MNSQKRRHWKAEEKLQMIEEARKTDSTVSEVCRRYGIGTGQFYTWEKHARQGALAALRNVLAVGDPTSKQEEALKSELERLRVVIAELSMENLELKKGRWA
jgi:transposase